MSTDWGARAIVGVLLSDIYTEEVGSEEKTKYDPDTGTPYKVQVSVLNRTLFGKHLPSIEANKKQNTFETDKFNRNFNDLLKPYGLKVFFPYWCEDDCDPYWCEDACDIGIVGIVVSTSADIKNWNQPVNLDSVQEKTKVISDALTQDGYTPNVQLFVQLEAI